MSLIQEFSTAISQHGKAFSFIRKNGLSWTFLIPIAIFLILATIGFYSMGELAELLADKFVTDYIFITTLLVFFLKILFFVILGKWGGYLVVIIMSPFLAYISEKTEKIITGNDYPFNFSQFLSDVIRGILLALRNFCIETLIGIVLYIFSFFTVGIAVPIVSIFLVLVSAYFYGFSFIDYTNERRKLSVSESVRYVRQRKAMSCGHGIVFALLIYIPIIGVALSAFYSIIATVAATQHVLEDESRGKNQFSELL